MLHYFNLSSKLQTVTTARRYVSCDSEVAAEPLRCAAMMRWQQLPQHGAVPAERSSHTITVIDDKLYL